MIIENPERFRQKIREFLNKILTNEKKSSNLEKGIYNWSIKKAKQNRVVCKWNHPYFVDIYTHHFRSIYFNLKNNETILNQLNSGKIKSKDLAFMTPQELKPELWKELIDAKTKRDKNEFEGEIEAATDEFKCFKCGKRKCTYYQLQLRSADEPMTTFVTCLNCGNRWKC